MEDLEIVLPAGVQVSTLEPIRATDGSITLHLRVIGPRDRAIDLVRNLEGSKDFLQPRIVGENSESSGSPGEKLEPVSASNRVNFDLLVNYNPVSPTESGTTKKKLNQRSEKSEAAAAERQKGNPGSKLKSQPNSQVEKKLAPAASLVAPSAPAASPTSAPVQPVRPRFTGQAPPFTSAPYPAQNQRVPAPQTTPVAHPNTGGPQ
jgi:type IV pilus assembly protein PilN